MIASRIAPTDLAEAAAILTEAARRKDALAFAGGGTELGYGYPAERLDLVVETRGLARVVEYAPADMVVEVEAGCTLAALQAVLEPARQRLAIDPPDPERATLGGLLATNAFGPLRMRYGTLRDLIVGITLIRADGVRARGGGRVVKNVAGFDLPKVAVGSLGSLGLIATATFRLHPLPAAAAVLEITGLSMPMVRTLVRAFSAAQLEPAAFSAERSGDGYLAAVLFEGFEAGVAEQCERAAAIGREHVARPADLRDASSLGTRDRSSRTYGNLRLRLAAPPSELDALETGALMPLYAALPGSRSTVYPALGVAFVNAAMHECAAASAAANAARAALAALGGHLVVLDAPAAFRDEVDVFGPLPPAFGVMRALKDRFDPERRLNSGRFVGRL